MKKAFVLVLTLVMLLSAVPALAELSAPGVYPFSEETQKLTVWSPQLATFEDFETSDENVYIEKLMNVDVTWIAANSSEMKEKFNLALADPNRPDIFLNNISNDEIMLYAEDGVVIPLEDLIDNHTVALKKLLDENPSVREQLTAPDGHIYQLPNYMYLAHESTPKMWVYKPYLEAYTAATGKGKPNTTAEFKEMLIYFRDHDMNGNGVQDEIPLTGTYHYGTDGQDPIYWIANAFTDLCAGINTYFMLNEDGESFYCVATTDEFREALKFANELFEEKLLVEDTYVQDLFQFRLLTSVPKDAQTVCCASAPYPYRLMTANADPAYTAFSDWEVILPLDRPDGTKNLAARREFNFGTRSFITSSCADPVLAIKWLDYFYTEEGRAWGNFYGQENVHWAWVDEPSIGGGDKAIKSLVTWGVTQNVYFAQGWGPNTYRLLSDYQNKAASDTFTDSALMAIYFQQQYEPYVSYSQIPQIVWCDDQDLLDEKADLSTAIDPKLIEYATNFIMGKLDVEDDAVWEAFKTDLNKMGLERYIEVLNEYTYGE